MTIRDIAIAFGYEVDEQSEKKANESIEQLKSVATKALGAIGIGFSLANANQIIEEFGKINAQIKNATKDLDDQEAVQNEIIAAANEARTAYADIANATSKLVQQNRDLFDVSSAAKYAELTTKLFKSENKEQGDILALQESINNAFAKGAVEAETVDQILEQSPAAAELLAKEVGAARFELSQMASDGQISLEQLRDAFLNNADEINAAFSNVDLTITDALLNIRNQWGLWLTQMDKTLGVTKTIAKLMTRTFTQFMNLLRKVQTYTERFVKSVGGAENALKLLAIAAGSIVVALNAGKIIGFLKNIKNLVSGIKLKTVALVAVIMLIALAVDDFINFMKGNNSVIGVILEKWGIDADAVRQKITTAFNSIKEALVKLAPMIAKAAGAFMAWKAVRSILPETAKNATSLTSIVKLLGKGIKGLGSAFQFLLSPAGLVVAAIAALVAIIALLIKNGGDVDALVQQFTNGISKFTEIIDNVVAGISEKLPQIIDTVVGVLIKVLNAIVDKLPSFIDAGITLITSLLNGIMQMLPLIIEAIIRLVTALIAAIVGMLPQLIDAGVQLIMALLDGILGALPDIIKAAVDLIPKLVTAIVSNLPKIIKAGIQIIISLITGIAKAIPQIIKAVIGLIPVIVSALIEALPQLVQAGIEIIIALALGLVQAIPELVKAIPQIIGAIIDGLSSIFGDMDGIISGFVDMFKSAFSAVADFFKNIWGGISDFFKGIWDGIKNIFSGVGDFFGSIFKGAVDGIKNAFSGIKDFFSNIFQSIVNVVKAPINWIIGGINGFIDGINGIKIPDWVPGIGGASFNIPHIPELAKGGVLKKGQTGYLEGDGAEAVVPLEKNTGWISKVAALLKNSMGESGANGLVEAIKGIGGTVGSAMKSVAAAVKGGEKKSGSDLKDSLKSFVSNMSALSQNPTASPATARSMVAGATNRSVTQNNYFESTFNGDRAGQKRSAEAMSKSANDATGQLARALAYSR